MLRGKPLLFAGFWPFFQRFKNGSERPKNRLGCFKINLNGLVLIFQPFLKNGQNGRKSKGLPDTIFAILTIFSTF